MGQRVPDTVAAAESVDVDVEMAVGDCSFVGAGQPQCDGARESDDGEHDVGAARLVAKATVTLAARQDRVEEGCDAGSFRCPVRTVQERTDQVEHPNPAVDRCVHVLTESPVAVGSLRERRLGSFSTPVEDVVGDGVQQGISVGKVSVEGADADIRSAGDRIERGFGADVEDHFDGGVEKTIPVALGIGPHVACEPYHLNGV